MGVKLCAQGIDKAIAGTPIMVIGKDDDEDVSTILYYTHTVNTLNLLQHTYLLYSTCVAVVTTAAT
jgi:hypothetical protein